MLCESDESDLENTPPEILEMAADATHNILPEKSKTRYIKVYDKFMDWRLAQGVKSFSENVLVAYFGELTKQFRPSSLWAIYSMLKTVLNVKNDVNIAKYPKLKAYLKRQSDGYKSKKSKILKPEEINQFLREAPDTQYLLSKVILIFGISGACRKQELKNVKITDIEDTGKTLVIKIPDTKTKISRSFIVSGSFYDICKKYLNLRQKIEQSTITQLFLNYQKGKCCKQVVGINKIGKVPKQIANFLQLPNSVYYTGHCFRRSSATILVDAGGDLMALKRHGGWKSSAVAEGYVDNSISSKTSTASKILNSIEDNFENRPDLLTTTNEVSDPIINEPSTSAPRSTIFSMPSLSTTLTWSKQPIIIENCQNL